MRLELEEELRSKDARKQEGRCEETATAVAAFCRRCRMDFDYAKVVDMGSTRNEKECKLTTIM